MISHLAREILGDLQMNESRVPVLIRIRASLKARIEELAKREHRSTNQQIEFLLERALAQIGEDADRSADAKREAQTKEGRDLTSWAERD